jgi:SAM-dependent methyltransferase
VKLQDVYDSLDSQESVLDLGTGHGTVLRHLKSPSRLVGVDACKEALAVAKKKVPLGSFRCMDIRGIVDAFGIRSFQSIVGFDIIEHLEKADALALLQDCEAVATRVIWWFVPVGSHPQEFDPRNEGNEELQRHRSEWQPEEFAALGYRVWHFPDWHTKKDMRGKESGAAFCRKLLKDPEQPGVIVESRY